MDFLYLGLIIGFFLLTGAMVHGLEHLRAAR